MFDDDDDDLFGSKQDDLFSKPPEPAKSLPTEPTKVEQKVRRILRNPFPNDKFYTLPNWKSLQETISNVMKMANSNFSFSRCVFKRLVMQTLETRACLGNG